MIVSPQELITKKIQYVKSRFNKKITPLVAIRYKDGVLILAKNTVELYCKTSILWNNKIVYGAVGEHQDIEKTVVQIAGLCNYISTYLSEDDIHIQWLARKAGNLVSDTLKSGTFDCLIVRLVLADKNSIILINEVGMILPVEHFTPHRAFIVLTTEEGSERQKIEEKIKEKLTNLSRETLSFDQALKIAKEGLDVNPEKVFYELTVIDNNGCKTYNHAKALALLEDIREGKNE